jgi:hypothetical protein
MRLMKHTSRLLVCLTMVLATSSGALYAQERSRLISVVRSGMTPSIREPGGRFVPTDLVVVEVIEFKLAGVPIIPGQSFPAGDDWLKDLTVKVKNISAKPISYLSMDFAMPEAKYVKDGREYRMGYSLEYKEGSRAKEGAGEMKVVKPGEEAELVYLGPSYSLFRQRVAKDTGVTSITSLQSGGDMRVHFTDGSIWMGSNLRIY